MKKKHIIALLFVVGVAVEISVLIAARQPPIAHFEAQAFTENTPFIEPAAVDDGLAVYVVGSGAPVLLMPYPHAHTVEPAAQGPLADALVEMGRTVITFDVPGAYRSTQPPVGDMAEMVSSALRTLQVAGVTGPVDVAGHSMGGLSALAFAIEHPQRTQKLLLVGAMSGFPAVLENGMPRSIWKITDVDYWKFILLGLKVKTGFGNLADHKRLYNIMGRESYHDPSAFIPLEIHRDDKKQGTPIREILWGKNIFNNLNYADRLSSVQAPTLIVVGRYDTEAPVPCSEELDQGIPDSRLVIMEQSGHSPHVEERAAFIEVAGDFLQ